MERSVSINKLNNKGLSLAELIVAMSIGVIVSLAIAGLLVYTIRTYRNESVNTSTQYEIQSGINMMMDEIMSASVFVIEQNDSASISAVGAPYTKYAMFGTPNTTLSIGGKGFKGVIFTACPARGGRFNIYMNRFESAGTDLTSIASAAYATVEATFPTDPALPLDPTYLLGEDATMFVVDPVVNNNPDGNSLVVEKPDPADATTWKYVYRNPIEVSVELRFQKDGWGTKQYNKRVSDKAYLRNKVTQTVYVKGPSDSAFTTYTLKKKD